MLSGEFPGHKHVAAPSWGSELLWDTSQREWRGMIWLTLSLGSEEEVGRVAWCSVRVAVRPYIYIYIYIYR